MAYDFNYGAGGNVTPYQFQIPTGMGVTDPSGYSSLNSFGLASPTSGAGAPNWIPPAGSSAPAFGGLGMNLPTLQLGLQGLGTAANLYSGIKALGLARDQFAFQKAMADKNLANQTTSYNTALEDRANARASVTGQSSADTQAYINAHKLN